MKVRKTILYTGAALWLIAFIQLLSTGFTTQSDEEAIVTAFADNDFFDTISTISAVGTYGSQYIPESEREALLLDIAHSLDISNSLVYDSETKDGITTSSLARTGDNAQTVLKLITVETVVSPDEISLKHTVSAVMEFDHSLENAFFYKDKLKNAFENAGINPDISIHLKGDIAGSLSMSQKNMIADKIIESSGGKIVTESRSNNLFTVYAYTDKIDDYVLRGSMKTNLNVAITYNEQKNVTEVYMATPFLNQDY